MLQILKTVIPLGKMVSGRTASNAAVVFSVVSVYSSNSKVVLTMGVVFVASFVRVYDSSEGDEYLSSPVGKLPHKHSFINNY